MLEMKGLLPSVSAFLFLASLVCFHGSSGVSGFSRYNTGAGIAEGKLNVHLVPHSHDDVGWLKTIDQYYVGSNNSIQVTYSIKFAAIWSNINVFHKVYKPG